MLSVMMLPVITLNAVWAKVTAPDVCYFCRHNTLTHLFSRKIDSPVWLDFFASKKLIQGPDVTKLFTLVIYECS